MTTNDKEKSPVQLSPLKQALYIIEKLENKLLVNEQEKKEPIAIIGMACRFPGGADNPEKYWKVLQQATDVIKEVPSDRWDVDAYYHAEPNAHGKMYTRSAGFVEQVNQFDAQFFGISPREAKQLDPQQRVLLEVAWEALESSGQLISELSESQTGVYIGISTHDYTRKIDLDNSLNGIDAYFATGNSLNAAAGRLAYFFGFQGPAMAIDTACSSSLVGLHLACQSLRNKECNMALTGGVNLILSPDNSIALSHIHALSPTNSCKAFDKKADGYVRGEGCGVVILKRLSDALKDNDNILALILGSAVNQDGHSSGLTVPNGVSQQKLIKQALLNAQISSERIDYVEAHGTGTSLGDPIEAVALGNIFKENLPNRPIYIGTAKANIGHLEAAAGIAGLIKVILSLKNQTIPAQLNFKEPNPYIPWDKLPIKVPTEQTAWLKKEKLRYAGVSGFGFTGTNAHLVVSEAPERSNTAKKNSDFRSIYPLVISGKVPKALQENVKRFKDYLKTDLDHSIEDICYTASVCRDHFRYRLAIIGKTKEALYLELDKFLRQEDSVNVFSIQKQKHQNSKIAFVFTGHQAQSVSKGRQLYENHSLCREIVDNANAWLIAQGQLSVIDLLYPELSNNQLINEILSIIPAVFVLEYALSALWKSWGIEPEVVMGNGIGEYVAACVAGVFCLEEGLKLIIARTKSMHQLSTQNENEINEQEFEKIAEKIDYKKPTLQIITNDTGAILDQAFNSKYWLGHRLESLKPPFSLQILQEIGVNVIIEIGPDQICLPFETPTLINEELLYINSWPSEHENEKRLTESLCRLYVAGLSINWKGYHEVSSYRKLTLPTYAFQREEFWPEPQINIRNNVLIHLNSNERSTDHPLLGKRLPLSHSEDIYFESHLSALSPVFLKYHRLFNTIVVPAASHISALLLAMEQAIPSSNYFFEDLFFPEALVISDQDICLAQFVITHENQTHRSLQVKSLKKNDDPYDLNSWQSHAVGKFILDLSHNYKSLPLENTHSRLIQNGQRWDHDEIYSTFWEMGYTLGKAFRWIESVWLLENQLLCKLKAPIQASEVNEYIIHPGLLDSCFQLLACCKLNEVDKSAQHFYLPFSIKTARFYKNCASSSQFWCYMQVQSSLLIDQPQLTTDFQLYDENNELVAEIIGFQARKAESKTLLLNSQQEMSRDLYQMIWSVQPNKIKDQVVLTLKTKVWLIFVDNVELSVELSKQLEKLNIHCVFVFPNNLYQQSFENEKQYFYINPDDQTHFQQLIYDAFLKKGIECQNVIFLWSLEKQNEESVINAELLIQSQKIGCMSVIYLVKTLVISTWKEIPQLWLFTCSCQRIGEFNTKINLKFASLWGLRNVIATEHPELRCVCIDLDSSEYDVHMIVNALLLPDGETHIAFRNNLRYVARLEQFSENSQFNKKLHIDKNASYLITGGFGGIGLQIAQWLFERGVRNLILIGRSDALNDAHRILMELKQKGAKFLFLKIDVSDFEKLTTGFVEIEKKMPPIKGVIHAAGILQDSSLMNETWENFYQVIAPKILGSYHIHLLTQQMELDFFICFSSIAAILGSQGQGAYSAANMFLDALISYRRELGLHGLSIDWGLWSEVGMATKLINKQKERLKDFGLGFIAPHFGLKILENSIKNNTDQLIVMPIDWSKFLKHFNGNVPILFNSQKQLSQIPTTIPATLVTQLENIPYEERHSFLLKSLCSMLADILQLPSGTLVDVKQGFFDLGLDSLMALELKGKIEYELGIVLPSTIIFNYPNILELVDHLMKKITSTNLFTNNAINTKDDLGTSSSEIEQLSNDEIKKLLLEKLK